MSLEQVMLGEERLMDAAAKLAGRPSPMKSTLTVGRVTRSVSVRVNSTTGAPALVRSMIWIVLPSAASLTVVLRLMASLCASSACTYSVLPFSRSRELAMYSPKNGAAASARMAAMASPTISSIRVTPRAPREGGVNCRMCCPGSTSRRRSRPSGAPRSRARRPG